MCFEKWIVCDLDGTLSSAAWRIPLAPMGPPRNWDLYSAHGIYDCPFPEMISLLRALENNDFMISVVTARPEKWRAMTAQWLEANGVPHHELIMKANDDYSPGADYKRGVIAEKFNERKVVLAFEDDPRIVAMYRSIGIDTHHVRESMSL